MTYSDEEKLKAVERELGYRRRVYGRQVGMGNMSVEFMQEQIGVMEAIRDDYREKVEAREPNLL